MRNPFVKQPDPAHDALKVELVRSERRIEAQQLGLARATARLLRKLEEIPIEEGIEGFGRDFGKRGA